MKKEELPDNIKALVKRHNENHDKIDLSGSETYIRRIQAENYNIRQKLVKELGVERKEANRLVDNNIRPSNFGEEDED